MYKFSFLIVLGLLVFLIPFLGFPSSYESVFLLLAGILIAFTAYSIRRSMQVSKVSASITSEPVSTQDPLIPPPQA